MGAIHSAILYLEERSYDNSTASHAAVVRPLVKLLLFPSVADRLYKNRIYRLIGSSALQSFLGIVILYCVFVAIYYPFHLIGLVITPIGSFSIFLLGVLLLLRWFARSLTFPGYTPYLQRQLSQEYLKAFARQLGEFYTVSAEVWYCSLLVLNGMPQESQQKRIQFGLKDLTVLSTHLIPQILINLERLVEEFSDSAPSPLSVQELSTLESLKEVIADLLARSHNAIAGPVGVALKGLSGQNVTSLMQLDLCLRPLAADKEAIASVVAAFEATEKLKTSLNIIMKPREPVNPSMLATIKKSISSVYSRPEGFERISFPLMRFSIGVQYSTTRFAVFGPDNNKIDCMFISECSSVESRDRFAEATSASVFEPLPLREGGVGVVLFCNPNAAIYEALSMTPRKGSYVGIYIDMGYDVVVYNYRGYACSEGTPTPDRLNADGLAVATYITRTIKSKIAFSADSGTNTNRTAPRFIVHGQSLGGMVACHVASCSPAGAVDLLVCDRTFASLDAVASRMLGGWAGTGLRQLACWNSNSVASFLNAKCTKLLLQVFYVFVLLL